MQNDPRTTELWRHEQWRCDLVGDNMLRLFEGPHRVVELAVDDEEMARTCAELWRAAATSLGAVPALSSRLVAARTSRS